MGNEAGDGASGQVQPGEDTVAPSAQCQVQPDGRLLVALGGDWTLGSDLPPLSAARDGLGRASAVVFEGAEVGRWDSSLVAWIVKLIEDGRPVPEILGYVAVPLACAVNR